MRSKLREIKRKSKRCLLGIEWLHILVFLEQHCLIPAIPVLLLMVPPLTHKSIPVWTITFVSSYQKVKLGKECFRKISPDGLKVKKKKERQMHGMWYKEAQGASGEPGEEVRFVRRSGRAGLRTFFSKGYPTICPLPNWVNNSSKILEEFQALGRWSLGWRNRRDRWGHKASRMLAVSRQLCTQAQSQDNWQMDETNEAPQIFHPQIPELDG